jgi:small-conductance mechanosensitive channel
MNEPHNQEVRRDPVDELSPVELMNTPQSHISALRVEIDALKHHAMEVDKRHTEALQAADRRWHTLFDERNLRLSERFAAQEAAVHAAFASAEKAVEREHTNSESWRKSANEWRGAMDDREKSYAMKEQVDATLASIHKEIDTLRDNTRGEITLIRETMRKEVETLRIDQTTQAGKAQGMDKMWGYIIAAISAMGAVGVTVAFVAKGH